MKLLERYYCLPAQPHFMYVCSTSVCSGSAHMSFSLVSPYGGRKCHIVECSSVGVPLATLSLLVYLTMPSTLLPPPCNLDNAASKASKVLCQHMTRPRMPGMHSIDHIKPSMLTRMLETAATKVLDSSGPALRQREELRGRLGMH